MTIKLKKNNNIYVIELNGELDLYNAYKVKTLYNKMAEKGIACNVHYKPLPLLTAYKNLGFEIKDYPNAYAHFANEVSLPLYTKLKDEEIDYVIENFSDIVKGYIR